MFFGTLVQQDVAAPGGGGKSVVSITPTVLTANSTAHAIAMPATVAANDLLLIFSANDGGSGDTPTTSDAGWTRAQTYSGGEHGAAIFRKKAAGTEGGTTVNIVTPSSEAMAAQCYRISGWGGSETADIVLGTAATGTGSSATVTSLTSGFGAVETLWIAVQFSAQDVTHTSGPTGYTLTNTGNAVSTQGQVWSGWKISTAASDSPSAFVLSGTAFEWVTVLVAIR